MHAYIRLAVFMALAACLGMLLPATTAGIAACRLRLVFMALAASLDVLLMGTALFVLCTICHGFISFGSLSRRYVAEDVIHLEQGSLVKSNVIPLYAVHACHFIRRWLIDLSDFRNGSAACSLCAK